MAVESFDGIGGSSGWVRDPKTGEAICIGRYVDGKYYSTPEGINYFNNQIQKTEALLGEAILKEVYNSPQSKETIEGKNCLENVLQVPEENKYDLAEQLKIAITKENYELAATLRDKINQQKNN